MKKRLLFFSLTVLLFALAAHAQKDNKSYEFNRGVDEFENGNYAKAYEFFEEELKRDAKSPEAWFYLAAISEKISMLGRALEAVGKCIEYTPAKNKEMLAKAHHFRSTLYGQLGDSTAELADLDRAVQLQPKDEEYLSDRGDYFYKHDDLVRSDADYERMLKINPKSGLALLSMSRNAIQRKHFARAVELCDRAMEVDPDTEHAVRLFRSKACMGLHDYDRAADDLTEALATSHYDGVLDCITELADSSFTSIFPRLQTRMVAEPENDNWIYGLGLISISSGHFAEAIPLLETAAQGGDDSAINGMLARCYSGVGAYDRAIEVKRLSIDRDSTDDRDFFGLAGMLLNAGRCDEAMTAINTYIDKVPDDGDGYSNRADIHQFSGRINEAIDDYTTAIVLLEPDGNSLEERYNRGLLYQSLGKMDEARRDWQHITSSPGDSTSCMAALAMMHLGNPGKAQQLMEAKLNTQESPLNRRFTLRCAAQLQTLMGNHAQAIDLLRQAVECGHISPIRLMHNLDLAPLRDLSGFKQIIEREQTPHYELSTTK